MMYHPRFTRQTIALPAVLVALSYAALIVLAAVCLFGHASLSGGHGHHGSSEAAPHNALCAWACQATSDAVVSIAFPMASSGFVVLLVVASSDSPASSSLSVLHSRGPPSDHILSIG
ncbi:MAG: hypothetical protein CAF44_011820 [Nitrospira sp. CG24D]|jgi:hypothetical protein|nr:MAG: hypothetical protein CAF44_011820 [Nitrospira sp. CG24D]